ncbi:MAG: universal stress protein [Gammaproteobacteria bacterium]|nr:universal stress protein [Gammaproteobacteria bacterium]
METLNHILLATDGSEHALHAARFAGMLSRTTGGKLSIVTVHNDDAVMLNAMGPAIWPATVPYSSMTAEEIRKTVEENARENLLPETRRSCGEGANIEAEVQLWGQVAEKICEYAEEHGCDLIVLGTRGQSNFSRLLLGSVSTQVTSHAHCPVTLVR